MDVTQKVGKCGGTDLKHGRRRLLCQSHLPKTPFRLCRSLRMVLSGFANPGLASREYAKRQMKQSTSAGNPASGVQSPSFKDQYGRRCVQMAC